MRLLRFVTAHRGDEASLRSSPLFQSLDSRYDLAAKLNNREGLSKSYNRYLNKDFGAFARFGPWETDPRDNDIVVFLHDDLEMLGNNVEKELNRWADEGFAILGLAGAARGRLVSPAVWANMALPGSHSGVSVFHNARRDSAGNKIGSNPEQPYPMALGPLRQVLMLDGLFIAVAQDLALPTGWRFDEDFDFHFYDLASCLNAHKFGLRMRTVFVPVIHWSDGMDAINDPIWKKNEATFLEKFKNFGEGS